MLSLHTTTLALVGMLTLFNLSVTAQNFDIGGPVNILVPRMEPCGAPASSCGSCGDGYLGCGSSTCFNPAIQQCCGDCE